MNRKRQYLIMRNTYPVENNSKVAGLVSIWFESRHIATSALYIKKCDEGNDKETDRIGYLGRFPVETTLLIERFLLVCLAGVPGRLAFCLQS